MKRKIPFEMVVANDNGLWGSTGNEVVTMTYKQPMWAILGTIDSANSHIAIRVALKGEIVMLNSGDTDPTFIETNIPWTMRCIGDDRQMGYLLIDYMIRKMHYKRIGIIRSSNRFGRFGVREIKDSARRLQDPVVIEMAYKVGSEDFSLQLERLKASNLDAVIHWGDGREGALILNQMRKMGMNQPYFVNDRCVSKEFVEIAGTNAEGVIAGYPWNPDRKDPKLDKFREDFRKRYNDEPDTYAAHAYDGMNMLMWAINAAGLESRQDPRRARLPCRHGTASRATSHSARCSTTWARCSWPSTRTGNGRTSRANSSAFRSCTSRLASGLRRASISALVANRDNE